MCEGCTISLCRQPSSTASSFLPVPLCGGGLIQPRRGELSHAGGHVLRLAQHILSRAEGEFDAKSLVQRTRQHFTDFNVPVDIATDRGPQMMSSKTV